MKNTEHFYRCFGCSTEHPTEGEAKTCCAVVQEIWRCRCGEEFSSSGKAIAHLETSGHKCVTFDPSRQPEQPAASQSFASGWNNFAAV